MSLERFRGRVGSVAELVGHVGEASALVWKKELTALDDHMRAFIEASPFVLLGTVGRDGRCDVSPRGDPPGVAKVLDPTTLVLPERRGNRRADSLRNIVETGRVGLLFLIPGVGESLRVNGRACVFRDEEALAPLAIDGRPPLLGIGVAVEECYLQCGKALIRSGLWAARDGRPDPPLASFARMLLDQTRLEGESEESLGRMIEESYRNNLY